MKFWRLCALFFTGLCLQLIAHGADTAKPIIGNSHRGFVKSQKCQGCHNVTGYRYPSFPHPYEVPYLGGQYAEYIKAALIEYHQKKRAAKSMIAAAAPLTEQDMADLAAYYQSMRKIESHEPSVTVSQKDIKTGEKIFKLKACAACHGAGGLSKSSQYPILAHQHDSYIRKALMDYRSKKRQNIIMSAMAVGLTDQDIHYLSIYLSSQPAGVFPPANIGEYRG